MTAALTAPRLFGVKEANALVPRLNQLFTEVREEIAAAQQLGRDLEALGHPIVSNQAITVDPLAPAGVREKQRELKRRTETVLECLEEVAELGAEVKSVDGLVDFRSRRHGEIVNLCWKFPETEITHWHDLRSGFAGRQRLTDLREFQGDFLQ